MPPPPSIEKHMQSKAIIYSEEEESAGLAEEKEEKIEDSVEKEEKVEDKSEESDLGWGEEEEEEEEKGEEKKTGEQEQKATTSFEESIQTIPKPHKRWSPPPPSDFLNAGEFRLAEKVKLGAGSFGCAYKVHWDRKNEDVCVKMFDRNNGNRYAIIFSYIVLLSFYLYYC